MGASINGMSCSDWWMPADLELTLLIAVTNSLSLEEEKYRSIEELFNEGPGFGISIERQGDRIVFGEDCDREKVAYLEELVETIAPFMGGGEIYMEAEGSHWKWVFKDKKLLTFEGVIVYQDELSPAWLEAVEDSS